MKKFVLLSVVLVSLISNASWINPDSVSVVHEGKTWYVPRPDAGKVRLFYVYGYTYEVYSDGSYKMIHYPGDGSGIPLFRS